MEISRHHFHLFIRSPPEAYLGLPDTIQLKSWQLFYALEITNIFLTTLRAVMWWHCKHKKYTSCTFVSYLYCCLFIGYIYPLAPRLCLNAFYASFQHFFLLFPKKVGLKILIHCLWSNMNIFCYIYFYNQRFWCSVASRR